jgi:hypothetical protein
MHGEQQDRVEANGRLLFPFRVSQAFRLLI